jgi:proline racemase
MTSETKTNPSAPADVLTVTDMHTAGEPVRILDGRGLDLGDGTILQKRARLLGEHDHIRQALMLEPRGHADMYGAILVEPNLPGAEAAVLFMHNSGYSTMCGHATIALGRFLNDRRAAAGLPRLEIFVLECPCGPVTVHCTENAVSFDSVACFADSLDETIQLKNHGEVKFDLGYGGAYYAILSADRLGIDLGSDRLETARTAAGALVQALRHQRPINHPTDPDLGFLYGAILTDGGTGVDQPSRHICWFGEGQIDRSPTGSGVSARLAIDHARGSVEEGEVREYAGASGAVFKGSIQKSAPNGVIARVSGQAFYTGRSEFRLEVDDPFRHGLTLPD